MPEIDRRVPGIVREALLARKLARAWDRVGAGYGLAAEAWAFRRPPPQPRSFDAPGLRGLTPVHTRQSPDGTWEARCGVAILGYAHRETRQDSDPFAPSFRDAVIVAVADSEAGAVAALDAAGLAWSASLEAGGNFAQPDAEGLPCSS